MGRKKFLDDPALDLENWSPEAREYPHTITPPAILDDAILSLGISRVLDF